MTALLVTLTLLAGGCDLSPAIDIETPPFALYQAVRTASVLFGETDPFAEPADLPGNVVGGFGLVGAVAVSQVAAPER